MQCTQNATGSWTLATLWVNLAYDTAVFIAVSTRLASYANLTTKNRIRTFLRGERLSHFKLVYTLLRGGQLFYVCVATLFPASRFPLRLYRSTTVGLSLLASIMGSVPDSVIYKSILPLPALVIEVIMACKVFRSAMLETTEASDSGNETELPRRHSTTDVGRTENGTIIEFGTLPYSFQEELY